MFVFDHNNINVLDLEKSVSFYEEALGLKKIRVKEGNGFQLVFMGDGTGGHMLELTYLHDRKEPYDLGDNEFHLCMRTDDFDPAYRHHKEMGCICYENQEMGIYFISDPDGYWTEIIPAK